MLIQLDLNSESPLYEQLVQQIIWGIAKGWLEDGEELPSVRQLAADLGINLHTVHKAYQVLRDKGLIRMEVRSGAVVSLQRGKHQQFLADLERQLLPLLAEAKCHQVSTDQLRDLMRKIIEELE